MQPLLNKIIITLLFIGMGQTIKSQNSFTSDIQLITTIKVDNQTTKNSTRSFLYSNQKNLLKKYNPVNLAFGSLLYLYQNTISQQFSATCLYHPSCSDFSKQSIQKYGLVKGIFLSADRVMRCNRMAATGIHPLRIKDSKATDSIDFYKKRK
jgi:putative membrane protein insertion efficiency factor